MRELLMYKISTKTEQKQQISLYYVRGIKKL